MVGIGAVRGQQSTKSIRNRARMRRDTRFCGVLRRVPCLIRFILFPNEAMNHEVPFV